MDEESVPTPLGYRPALDGLRALSVLSVIIYHARPSLLPGGFLGVDVFFVLSGFLITTLLLEEKDRTGRIAIGQFYRRRGLRLFPALVALLLFCMGLGLIAGGDLVETTQRGVLPVVLYVANWAEAFGVDLGGLNHVWSLAIEEQFYLLWPLLLLGFLRLRDGRRRALVFTLAAATAVMLVRTVAVQAGVPWERLYFGLDARADGVLIGCALALARNLGVTPGIVRSRIVGLAGFALLGYLLVSWKAAFIVVMAADLSAAVVVVHVLVHPAGWLEREWLVRIGRLSYGLYLWHWPTFYLLRVQEVPARIGLAVALTLAAASLSGRFVERPFLELNRRRAAAQRSLAPNQTAASPDPSLRGSLRRAEVAPE